MESARAFEFHHVSRRSTRFSTWFSLYRKGQEESTRRSALPARSSPIHRRFLQAFKFIVSSKNDIITNNDHFIPSPPFVNLQRSPRRGRPPSVRYRRRLLGRGTPDLRLRKNFLYQ